MKKFVVKEEHQCWAMEGQDIIVIQKDEDENWHMIDLEHSCGYGIGYCPFCGEMLVEK